MNAQWTRSFVFLAFLRTSSEIIGVFGRMSQYIVQTISTEEMSARGDASFSGQSDDRFAKKEIGFES